jgi:lipopolysaccharide transport system permease protein
MISFPPTAEDTWTIHVRPTRGWFELRFQDLWRYRDLVLLLASRDFTATYKQTILGPFWHILQPASTTFVFTVIFSHIARIPTDGVPPVLFYLSGLVVWRYFSDCVTKTSNTFIGNAGIFGKVYFPRLTVPLAIVISNLASFGIQLALFLAVWAYYRHGVGAPIAMGAGTLLLPLLALQMAALGLGCGIIVSSLTTKYRDLAQLVSFGTQLWMYVTPIVYPASVIPPRLRWLLEFNPMATVVETFRHAFLGTPSTSYTSLVSSWGLTVAVLFSGVVLFNRVEKDFMDTV